MPTTRGRRASPGRATTKTRVQPATHDDDATSPRRTIERVQTGVRIEKRVFLVLKGLAAALDVTLGDLLEGIVLHAFDGKTPFNAETLATIDGLRAVYKLDLTAEDSHLLVERTTRR